MSGMELHGSVLVKLLGQLALKETLVQLVQLALKASREFRVK